MRKHIPLYIYGLITILSGVFLLISQQNDYSTVRYGLGIVSIVGGIFAIITALSGQRKQVQFAYHEMHGVAMLVYGIAILLFCKSPERLEFLTSFLFIFYAFSEIIFCIWLFNLAQKVILKIAALRVVLALAIGIGAIYASNYTESTVEIFGALFILIGINIILYVPIMKQSRNIIPHHKVYQ